MIYAYGAWNVGNIGDDAILEGEKLRLGCPELPPWKQYTKPEDVFVLGGGGLCHSRGAIDGMKVRAKRCRDRGTQVQMRAMGIDSAPEGSFASIVALCRLCDVVSVRAHASVGALREAGIPAEFEPDFAFDVPMPEPPPGRTVGALVVPNLDVPRDRLLKLLPDLADKHGKVVVTSHVPRHKTDPPLSEEGYLSGVVSELNHPLVFWQKITTGSEALALYASAEKAFIARYHGLVFAWMTGTPAERLVSTPKLHNFSPPEDDW